MKVLILVSCALAAASATYAPYAIYPQHIPVIDHNGVPVEPLENQQARAAHYAAHAEASSRSGYYSPLATAVYAAPVVSTVNHLALPADTPEVAAAKIQHYQDYAIAAQRNGVNVHYPLAQISAHPVDTPEVQLAKAEHFAAHAAARGHLRKRRGVYGAYPVINNGVPVNTPEVQHATAQHLAAHAAITGVPLDTPEVAAAKAQHFAAHAAAGHGIVGSPYIAAPYLGSPVFYGSVYPHATIGPDGHPVETPEVQLAKAAHFAAHASVHHY